MTEYIYVLTALEYLLDRVGEKHWRDWLRQDMGLWRSKKDVSHHLSAYGGMGSFNDIWISVQNKNNITKVQEPWVNNLFDLLKCLCYQLAHNLEKDEANKKSMDSATSQFPKTKSQLYGWRCLKCGHAETNSCEIDNYLAKMVLPGYLGKAETESELKALVDAAFTTEIEGINKIRSQLAQTILNSGIKMVDRESWMRPCPTCGSDDTAVYRWQLNNNIFTASKDNLPLKNANT